MICAEYNLHSVLRNVIVEILSWIHNKQNLYALTNPEPHHNESIVSLLMGSSSIEICLVYIDCNRLMYSGYENSGNFKWVN